MDDAGVIPDAAPPDSALRGRRAFVAGATGYTGREVVRILAESGAHVVAHVRPDSARLDAWRARFEAVGAVVSAAAWTDGAMRDALAAAAPDAVFALLGTTQARGRAARDAGRLDTYETVDHGLTALLLRATADAAPAARFVYLSSIGVREGVRNPYLAARAKVEAALRASSLAWTVARPAFITGPDRDEPRPAERAAAAVSDAVLNGLAALGLRGPRERWGSMDAATLAHGLIRIAFDPTAEGRIIEAAGLRGG